MADDTVAMSAARRYRRRAADCRAGFAQYRRLSLLLGAAGDSCGALMNSQKRAATAHRLTVVGEDRRGNGSCVAAGALRAGAVSAA
jgi:hypothetical protein